MKEFHSDVERGEVQTSGDAKTKDGRQECGQDHGAPREPFTSAVISEMVKMLTPAETAQETPHWTVEEIHPILGGIQHEWSSFVESRMLETHSWTVWLTRTGLETCKTDDRPQEWPS